MFSVKYQKFSQTLITTALLIIPLFTIFLVVALGLILHTINI